MHNKKNLSLFFIIDDVVAIGTVGDFCIYLVDFTVYRNCQNVNSTKNQPKDDITNTSSKQ